METFSEFDHCVIAVDDLKLALHFYGKVLAEILGDCQIHDISMLSTDEIAQAKQLADRRAKRQQEEVRVGAERAGGGYTATSNTGVMFGEALIPIFLYTDHVQDPPPEQLRGTPRLGFPVTLEQMAKATDVLCRYRIPFEGPIDHPAPCPDAQSLYFKDPSSNFVELSVPRT